MDQTSEDFADFYWQFRAGCLKAVYATVGDRLLAEELVSEGFARACASWRKVSRHPAPQAWVVRTALNLHVSWWRRRRREVGWEDRDLPDRPAVEPATDGDVAVFAALRTLPVRQREVVALRLRCTGHRVDTAARVGGHLRIPGRHAPGRPGEEDHRWTDPRTRR